VAKALFTGYIGNIKTASRMYMYVLWRTLSGLTSVKEAVFCNFDLAYLPCHLHPPPDISCDEEYHEKGRVQYCLLYLLYAKFRTLFLLPSSVRKMLQNLLGWAHIIQFLSPVQQTSRVLQTRDTQIPATLSPIRLELYGGP
jgi:hypothetical protein